MMKKDNEQIKTRHQCITSMDAYKSKDIEELRFGDYLAGRKQKAATPSYFLIDYFFYIHVQAAYKITSKEALFIYYRHGADI